MASCHRHLNVYRRTVFSMLHASMGAEIIGLAYNNSIYPIVDIYGCWDLARPFRNAYLKFINYLENIEKHREGAKMEQVKIFLKYFFSGDGGHLDFEKNINGWLEKNSDIVITRVTQSQGGEPGFQVVIISIFYLKQK